LKKLLEITSAEELFESLEKNKGKHFLPPDSKAVILNMLKTYADQKLDKLAE
jgi:hypothetical protein